MKFKLDENLPLELLQDLRQRGHQADHVIDEGLRGVCDEELMAKVKHDGRVLLTMDKGIADVRTYPPSQYAGLVLFRSRATGKRAALEFVRRSLPDVLAAELNGRLLVVSEAGIRLRS